VHDCYRRRGQTHLFSQKAANCLVRLPAMRARPDSDAQDITLPAEHRVLAGARHDADFDARYRPFAFAHCLAFPAPAIIAFAMPDMLVRLYALPDARPHVERATGAGFSVRRAEPWDRERMRRFATECFGELWSVEADRAFNHTPITGFVATRGPEIVGFGVYECTRRGFFGPTGVRESLRGRGLGSALLLRCLEAMHETGYAYAVIGGVGPVEFYEKVCGAFVIPGSEVGIYGPLFELRAAEPA
jgi:predicted N-acetyltransferase YhbS